MGEQAAADGQAPATFVRQAEERFHTVRRDAGPAGHTRPHARGQETTSRKSPHRVQHPAVCFPVHMDDIGRPRIAEEPLAFPRLPAHRLFRADHARDDGDVLVVREVADPADRPGAGPSGVRP